MQGALASSAGGLVPGTAVSLAQALDSPSVTLRLAVCCCLVASAPAYNSARAL